MRRSGWTFAVVLVVLVALVVVQLVRTPPAQSVSVPEPASLDVAGSPSLSWPASAEGALEVAGVVRTSGRQVARPIASLAKMMTAYIVLRDHPLTTGESGPSITVTPTDVAFYDLDAASSGSVLAVTAGEVLTEQQALQALLVASADNIAETLAQWDAGSITAFVTKMNATAKSLGMNHTTYTDPSGLEDTTVSSARDQLVMAMQAMALPAFASIVAMPEVTFPVGGTVQNYDYDIGHDGVIGIKTGSDSESLGCWAFAATRTVAGTARIVYGVVLGVPGTSLGLVEPTLDAGVALADAVPATVQAVSVVSAGAVVGHVDAPWRHGQVPVTAVRAVSGLAQAGRRVTLRVDLRRPSGVTVRKGELVGHLVADFPGGTVTTPLVAGASGAGPSLPWKLTHL
jgi:serine-type D-Ala-D-Ala carboxypeptidase (penicillin-binding protein 5/6)